MEKPFRSKKQVITIEIIATILLFASFAALIVCGMLKDNGYGDFWWPLAGMIGFFVFALSSLALLIFIRKDAIACEIEAKEKRIDALPLHNLQGLFPGSIQARLLEHKFEDVGDDFFRRKVFSAAKDSICYYAKCFDSIPIKDVFAQAMEDIQQKNESGNVCLLLFVSQRVVLESDLEDMRNLSKYYLVTETTIPMPGWQSCVPILINSSTSEGFFLDTNKKYSLAVYTYGCKMLNRIFS